MSNVLGLSIEDIEDRIAMWQTMVMLKESIKDARSRDGNYDLFIKKSNAMLKQAYKEYGVAA